MDITNENLAYIAGFIDGEGHVSAHKSHGYYYAPRIDITNTNFNVLAWIKEETGTVGDVRKISDQRIDRKQCFRLAVGGKSLLDLCKKILPYIKVKKRQIEILLEFPRADKRELQEVLYQELMKLNQKGPNFDEEINILSSLSLEEKQKLKEKIEALP